MSQKEVIKSKLEVFDPPMCCSTGICGPSFDPVLPRFAADLEWLKTQGVVVERYNLAQQPSEFSKNEVVKRALEENGNECLPLILVSSKIVSRGAYPTHDELASFAGINGQESISLYSPEVAELVAIGAAMAANCLSCLKYHHERAKELGVSDEDISRAVATAEMVKQVSAHALTGLANRYLGVSSTPSEITPEKKSSCCPGTASKETSGEPAAKVSSSSKCCG